MFKKLQTIAAVMCYFTCQGIAHPVAIEAPYDVAALLKDNDPKSLAHDLVIKSIIIKGNKYIGSEVIKSKLPFQVGATLDVNKSPIAINNLYALGAFKQIEVRAKTEGHLVHIIIDVQEKKLLEGVSFRGNEAISSKKIQEKLELEKLAYIDEEAARLIAKNVRQMFVEDGYQGAQVDFDLVVNEDNPDKMKVEFTVTEGKRSHVIRVQFRGNKKIPARKLSLFLATRERWLMSWMDESGLFDESKLEQDKRRIEMLYFDNGFFGTKVYKTDVQFSPDRKEMTIVFHIEEGEQYIIRSIQAPGDDIVSKEEAAAVMTIQEGQPLARRAIVDTMDRMAALWKEKGYIYANIVESIRPDDKAKAVDLVFMVNASEKLYANLIHISGNKSTRDHLIRRRLDILEGDLITNSKLENSKRAVEFLSFYEPNGVNWKVHRISDALADLELNVAETKTGNVNGQLSYGAKGDSGQGSEVQVSALVEKGNLLGQGIDTGVAVKAGFNKGFALPALRRFEVRFVDPHIFDKDVSCGFYLYRRGEEYDRWTGLDKTPTVNTMGTNVRFGFGLPEIDRHLSLVLDLGAETIHTNNPKRTLDAKKTIRTLQDDLDQLLIDRTFQQGSLLWVGLDLVQDKRNHQVYPSRGHKISIGTKLAPSPVNQTFGFWRLEAAASVYNSILNDDDLVLGNNLKICAVGEIGNRLTIPYKELFHMGGPNTIRGHVWSGIGPAWKATNEPLGGRFAIQSNNELIFPIAREMGMRAHFFYDVGAAWDTPDTAIKAFNAEHPNDPVSFKDVVIRNNFKLRHTVGFGFNLTSPFPVKIDWGFKLDRDRKSNESAQEFHLSMNYAW